MKRRIRLLNFLIDSAIALFVVMLSSYFLSNMISQETMRSYGILFYSLYYLTMEYALGQTVGKMVTNSKVVALKNKRHPSFLQIFMRTLLRFIPLEFLSYLFKAQGIHDYLSKTELIKKQ